MKGTAPASTRRAAAFALATLLATPAVGRAQTIPIRTVPVASGDQFLILPSATMSMGGVRLAVDDSLSDAWSNPAKGAFLTESAFVGAPTLYTISERRGSGRTFPVAALLTGRRWFGGGALALQQIDDDDGGVDFLFARPAQDACCIDCCGGARTLSDELGRNLYASAFAGARVGGGWSVGLGVSGSRLGAMDGVDLLYAGAQSIDQSGTLGDVRIGMHRSSDRDRLSVVLLHGRVSMTHEVTYAGWVWDEASMTASWRSRMEVNEDETRTWGGRIAWDRSLSTPGWRLGGSFTMNYKDHPKIPNYSIQNIPRDPGTSWAYEAAFGFARTRGATTFALDVALQPVWSETWQEADADDVADSDGRLRVGDRSIENEFFFTNLVVRSGLSHAVGPVQGQIGLELRSYAYELDQLDHVDRSFRNQEEAWIEWSPTFGAVYRFDALDLRYAGRVTTGTGLPGSVPDRASALEAQSSPGADFLLAPDGPLTLRDARVVTHQLSVRIPIR